VTSLRCDVDRTDLIVCRSATKQSPAAAARIVRCLLRTTIMRIASLLFSLLLIAASHCGAETSSTAAAPKKLQFLGILRLEDPFHADSAWTAEAKAAVGQHFLRLRTAAKEGRVILAGRTTESNEKTMGLVIFEAASMDAALEFMNSDPAVVAGVMKAEVRPYQVAIIRDRLSPPNSSSEPAQGTDKPAASEEPLRP
jgi:uncharacterized protein